MRITSAATSLLIDGTMARFGRLTSGQHAGTPTAPRHTRQPQRCFPQGDGRGLEAAVELTLAALFHGSRSHRETSVSLHGRADACPGRAAYWRQVRITAILRVLRRNSEANGIIY